jgi:hypothetical protein
MIPGNAEISAGQHNAVLQRTRADQRDKDALVAFHPNISTTIG